MDYFNFIGTKIRVINYESFRFFVENWYYNNLTVQIVAANVNCVVSARKNKKVAEVYKNSELVLPDGMPFVIWMNLFGKKKVDQFDATNILLQLIEHSKTLDFSFYFYGGSESVLKSMIMNLKKKFKNINISGSYSPPFRKLSEDEKQVALEDIKKSGARVVCVGLGSPKQDIWVYEHKSKLPGTLFVPSGAVFDFIGGRVKRAPSFISKIGFEWSYRLFSRDFKRLFIRYTVYNMYFLIHFLLQITRLKRYD